MTTTSPPSALADLAADIIEPIVIIVPTRGRPGNIVELIAACQDTAAVGYAELVIALDEDDPALDRYLDVLGLDDAAGKALAGVRVVIDERLRLGGTLNKLAPVFAVDRLGVGFMGDDHRPRTAGWDRRPAEELAGNRLGVVYGNDLVRGSQLPTAVVIGGPIIVELGYMVPRGAVHLYLDDYWLTLGRDLGTLAYLDDVVIEHLHPIAGTAPHDDRYAEVNAPELYTADEARFRRYLADEHPDALDQLRQLAAAIEL